MHLFLHWTGLDAPGSTPYNFWSGIAGDLFILGGVATLYKKHNCHAERCFRIAKHTHNGSPYCTKHKPNED